MTNGTRWFGVLTGWRVAPNIGWIGPTLLRGSVTNNFESQKGKCRNDLADLVRLLARMCGLQDILCSLLSIVLQLFHGIDDLKIRRCGS